MKDSNSLYIRKLTQKRMLTPFSYRAKEQKFYLNPISTSHAGEYICTVHTVDDTTETAALTLKLQGRKYWIGDSKMRHFITFLLLSITDYPSKIISPSVFLSVFMFQIQTVIYMSWFVLCPSWFYFYKFSFFGESQKNNMDRKRTLSLSLRKGSYLSRKVTCWRGNFSLLPVIKQSDPILESSCAACACVRGLLCVIRGRNFTLALSISTQLLISLSRPLGFTI